MLLKTKSSTLLFPSYSGDISLSGRRRLLFVICMFVLCYGVLAVRLVNLANVSSQFPSVSGKLHSSFMFSRPDIVDRNGKVLATDIRTPSLFANPRRMIDRNEAIDNLLQVLPALDRDVLARDLSSDKAFVFIKRELTPLQQAKIYKLGIPGLGFIDENHRVYPAGIAASHVLGVVNIDHEGLSGIELYADRHGKGVRQFAGEKVAPIELALDLRVQHSLREELVLAMEQYAAKAAAGIILDVRTGEVIAAASLPDFDPNDPVEAFHSDRLNRAVAGVFEMGSTFKIFTTAMALDLGVADLHSRYDARQPIHVASFQIQDLHAQKRVLSVSEIFIHSSNIGSARMALDVGVTRHKQFLAGLGLLDRLVTELPENTKPLLPANWTELSTMTIAFGHGLSVTPLQMVSAAAALVNGGQLIKPTFLKRDRAEAEKIAEQVLRPETSKIMRYLMRLNVLKGTATKAEAKGYLVGGKTGTAEKSIRGSYEKDKLLTNFIGAFPSNDPRYVIWVMLDEPKGTRATQGYATAGWNVAPLTSRVITRIAPMLALVPQEESLSTEPEFISFP